MDDHHACDLQGPFPPAMITENLYKCGIIEYTSNYVEMFFIMAKSDVNKCTDDYCRHELAVLRARNSELAKRTILFNSDAGEAASIKVEDIMASHSAVYKKTLAYSAEQNSLIERVWGTISAMARAMLADCRRIFWQISHIPCWP